MKPQETEESEATLYSDSEAETRPWSRSLASRWRFQSRKEEASPGNDLNRNLVPKKEKGEKSRGPFGQTPLPPSAWPHKTGR